LAVLVAKLRHKRYPSKRALLADAGFDATRAKRLCKVCRERVKNEERPIHPH
jgi:hypothetical protein